MGAYKTDFARRRTPTASSESWWIGLDRESFSDRLKRQEAARLRVSEFGGHGNVTYAPDAFERRGGRNPRGPM